MAVLDNTITTADINAALDVELASKFDREFSKLRELMGIFGVERVHAGQALYHLNVTGNLNTTPVVEGDEVPLSKYTVTKVPAGEITISPFRKLTTAQAIIQNGYVGAIARTDEKMLAQVRAVVVGSFIEGIADISTDISESVSGLQEAIAKTGAAVLDAVEQAGDNASGLVYFVNRQDAAEYLAQAPITTQNVFGMTYLENFLGAERVFISAMVQQGRVYCTPVDNIHLFGADWSALTESGLEYYPTADGLIGIHHEGNYARTSSETFVLVGALLFAEVSNYAIYATISQG